VLKRARENWPIRILPFTAAEKKALVRGADDATRSYQISFNLSAQPDAKWVELFQTSWYQQYGGGAIPRVTAAAILVASSIADLQIALSRLKLVVATANERYGALIERQNKEVADAQRQTEDKKRSAGQAMSDALDKLQF
jgi:hypothetical protein